MSLHEVSNLIYQNKEKSLEILFEFLRIPTVAAKNLGAQKAIDFLKKNFKEAGFECFIAETPGNPVFCAELNSGAEETITFYDHYDVQPEDPIELWDSPPFEPNIREGKIFARGVADNKGEIICRLQAIKAYKEIFGELPVNIKFIIEGEEEVGSPNLGYFVEKNKEFALNTNGIIWEFGGKDKDGIQQVNLGVKGILYLHFHTKTIGRDIHSGYTQFVDNAAYELVWALSSLKDRNDRILVPGFYEDIIPPSEKEMEAIKDFKIKEKYLKESFGIEKFRLNLSGMELKKKYFLEPTLNICGIWSGYQGQGSKTVTPKEAFAKVDCRLVPGQNPEDLVTKIRTYLDEQNFSHIEISSWDGYPAAVTPIENEFAQKVISVIKTVYNHDPICWPIVGGSGPMYLFKDIPCVSIGTGHSDSKAHAPNENIFVDDWIKGMELIASLIDRYK
ncbi:MAG: M20/M25/M40 family metallo-hydrolase [Candidatus Heimdallarchaeaceae archaeon]